MVAHLTPTPYFFMALSGIYGYLVMGLIPFLYAQVEIFKIDLEVWKNEFLFDEIPDNSGHLISVQLDYWVLHLYFGHFGVPFITFANSVLVEIGTLVY